MTVTLFTPGFFFTLVSQCYINGTTSKLMLVFVRNCVLCRRAYLIGTEELTETKGMIHSCFVSPCYRPLLMLFNGVSATLDVKLVENLQQLHNTLCKECLNPLPNAQ
jgi:hypothetical protein